MEICQSEELLEFTKEEAECLHFVHKLMNDDEELRPLIKFWTNELVLIMIRSFKLNPHKIFRVTKRLLHCCTVTFPDLFSLVDSAKLKPILAKKLFQRVNMDGNRCSKSPGIIVFRFNRWNPNDVSVDEAIAAGILHIYEASKDTFVQRNGGMFVMDADGIEFCHVKQVSFDVFKKLNCLLNALPLKFVGCVIMNSPPVMERLFNILKYALRARTRKLIHVVHTNLTPLHDMVPDKDLLPIYLGGEIKGDNGFLQGVEESVMRNTTLPSLVASVQKEYKILHDPINK